MNPRSADSIRKRAIKACEYEAEYVILMPYGVATAARGWATKNDVLNTRPLKELRKLLQRS